MAGFSEGQRLGHGVGGAHLADHDDVRRLAQGILQRHVEGLGVDTHLALGDQAVAVVVHKLDRVFNADDMPAAVLVAVAHHCGE